MTELKILPARLRQRSRSTEEIVLPLEHAIRAIDILMSAGWALLGWEGLVVHKNGHEERPAEFQRELGIERHDRERWDDFVRRSALLCRTSMMEAYNIWDIRTEAKDARMWFSLRAEQEGA